MDILKMSKSKKYMDYFIKKCVILIFFWVFEKWNLNLYALKSIILNILLTIIEKNKYYLLLNMVCIK